MEMMKMDERQFRLIVWGIVIQFARALGKYWKMADDIKIIKPDAVASLPVEMRGKNIDCAGIEIYK
jgi:hypothetical protein